MIILIIGNIWLFGNNLERSGELDSKSLAFTTALKDGNFGQCIRSISESNEELRLILAETRAEMGENNENNINVVTTDLT